MSDSLDTRRRLLVTAGVASAGLLLAATDAGGVLAAEATRQGKDEEKEVSAVEDLMREHGVLRRALLVYRESATKLRSDPANIDPKALHQTALLFRYSAPSARTTMRGSSKSLTFFPPSARSGALPRAISMCLSHNTIAVGRSPTMFWLSPAKGRSGPAMSNR